MSILRDPVSSASHFLMAAVAIVISAFLVRMTPANGSRRWSVLIFAGCMVLLYTTSGLYHAVQVPADDRAIFQLIDLSAIYLMIAGSVTPMAAVLVRGRLRVFLLTAEWTLAAIGILTLWLLPKPDHGVLVACYMSMVWLAFAGAGHFRQATGWSGIRWTLGSVAIYTTGAAADWLKWPVLWPGVIHAHEIMHFCDIGGTACYLVFLVRFVIPLNPAVLNCPAQAAPLAATAQA